MQNPAHVGSLFGEIISIEIGIGKSMKNMKPRFHIMGRKPTHTPSILKT